MTLVKATQMALVGTILALIVEILQWGMSTFAPKLLYGYGDNWLLYGYGDNWLRRIIWLAAILLQTVPLIIFLRVLSEKQKGGSNG